MKFGYTIAYVNDVAATMTFFEQAFGLSTRFISETAEYAELETGATILAFASHAMADSNLHGGVLHLDPAGPPPAIEIGLVTDDVTADYQRAVAAGAVSLALPATKPWGQVVAYLRDPEGLLIELCSPMGA